LRVRTSLQKIIIPLKKGIHSFFNYLKRTDFAPLPDMARLRGNDTQVLSRLFAVASVRIKTRISDVYIAASETTTAVRAS
jgi:hypothetical protein